MMKRVAPPELNLITCSFRGDFDMCRQLCASFDRFAPDTFVHSVFVPASDLPLFAELATSRRRIMAEEALLPRGFWKAPLPSPTWRRRLFLPRRNIYLTWFSGPVRGWVVQQIIKILATLASECRIVAFLDSDTVFVRPVTLNHLARGGKVRHFHDPDAADLPGHRLWYNAGRRLLGLPPDDGRPPGYINNLIVWRRRVVEGMTKKIAAQSGTDWVVALARTPRFAEYVLYGLYVDYIIGLEAAGHYTESDQIVHSCWSRNLNSDAEIAAFVEGLQPEHVACHIQSTAGMALGTRQHIYDLLTRRASSQDRQREGAALH
jgi:hypothetical protein